MGAFWRNRWFAPILSAGATSWALTIGITPALAQASGFWPILASLAYLVGSVVCHQQPERSFHIAAVQLPVCARCTGLYAGGAIGVLSWLVWRSRRPQSARALDPRRAGVAVLIASMPTAITALTAFAGLWDLTNIGRSALALPMGVAAGVVLAAFASNDLS